jgi:hypothetical protein
MGTLLSKTDEGLVGSLSPLWVICRHWNLLQDCPLSPLKRTYSQALNSSAAASLWWRRHVISAPFLWAIAKVSSRNNLAFGSLAILLAKRRPSLAMF